MKRQRHALFFGTDRNVTGSVTNSPCFGEDRVHELIHGTCEVSIPRGHQPGELESPPILRHFLERPDRHVVLLNVTRKTPAQAFAEVAEKLAWSASPKGFCLCSRLQYQLRGCGQAYGPDLQRRPIRWRALVL